MKIPPNPLRGQLRASMPQTDTRGPADLIQRLAAGAWVWGRVAGKTGGREPALGGDSDVSPQGPLPGELAEPVVAVGTVSRLARVRAVTALTQATPQLQPLPARFLSRRNLILRVTGATPTPEAVVGTLGDEV